MLAKAYYDKAVNDDSKEFYKKSIDSFNKLLSLGYKRPYVYRNIAIIYQQQLNDYQSAEETLLKMNEIYPQDVGCYTQLSLLNIEIENKSVIKGDTKSACIAAASIVAKVYRDKLMKEYAVKYPYYAFEENVGYGTSKHIEGIKQYGPSKIHRMSFLKNILDD